MSMRKLCNLSSAESLAEAKPRLNFPKEDRPHNLHVDVVDSSSATDITSKSS